MTPVPPTPTLFVAKFSYELQLYHHPNPFCCKALPDAPSFGTEFRNPYGTRNSDIIGNTFSVVYCTCRIVRALRKSKFVALQTCKFNSALSAQSKIVISFSVYPSQLRNPVNKRRNSDLIGNAFTVLCQVYRLDCEYKTCKYNSAFRTSSKGFCCTAISFSFNPNKVSGVFSFYL